MKHPSKWNSLRLFNNPKADALHNDFGHGHYINHPEAWRAGVIFASPHSGNIYPDRFISASRLRLEQLRRNEDIFVDALFTSAITAGAPLLCATFPRCFVDVNRAADELPQHWSDTPITVTPRAHSGIGVIPTHINENLPIYHTEPSKAEAQARIDALYHPYHEALQGLLDNALNRFGQALLVDCHSMPGFAPMGVRRADIILGDRFGKSCHTETLHMFKRLFTQAGYNVAVNHPYAGGFVTANYGKPGNGVETIQIEINRDLYVNPANLTPKPGFARLERDLESIIANVINARNPQTLAAQ